MCLSFQTMFEDKLRETDWEVTQDTIEEQVARESYLQWLRDNEKRVTHQGAVSLAPGGDWRVSHAPGDDECAGTMVGHVPCGEWTVSRLFHDKHFTL